MGWEVIGFGNIDVDKKHMQEITDLMIGDKKKIIDRLLGEGYADDFYDVEGIDGDISFRMSGNKGIDYERLDRIKAYCIKSGIDIEINVREYEELEGGGYYFNSGDEKSE